MKVQRDRSGPKHITVYTIRIDGRQVTFQLPDDPEIMDSVQRARAICLRTRIDDGEWSEHELHYGHNPHAFAFGRGNPRVYRVFAAEAVRMLALDREREDDCEVAISGLDADVDIPSVSPEDYYDD